MWLFQELEGDENFNIPEDPARDQNFKEPIIDALRAEKDEVVSILKLR